MTDYSGRPVMLSGALRGDPGPLQLEVEIERGRLLRLLGAAAALLVALHVFTQVIHHGIVPLPWLLRSFFDLDEEQALGTWFSALLLIAASGTALLCARARTDPRPWTWLAAGFAVLSMDEVVGLHEALNELTSFSWAIPGGVLALAVGAAFLPFLSRLPRLTALRLLLAGLVYVGGAVGVELAAEPLERAGQLDTLAYALTTALEEGLEMAGVLLFLRGALAHAAAGPGATRL